MKVRSIHRNNRVLALASAIAVTLCSGASANPANTPLSLLRNAPAIGAAVAIDGSSKLQAQVNLDHGDALARYTVILKDAPVATYSGANPKFAKAPLNAKGHLDAKSSAAVSYASYLRDQQTRFLSAAGTQIKRPLGAIMQFQHAVNGVVVELTATEAAELAARNDVLLVDQEKMLPLMTDRSTSFIGADSIWNGSVPGFAATQGEGIVIGDIDTGINFTSPSFAGVGPVDGYQHVNPLGAGNYLGQCKPGGIDAGNCNDKLIGLYNFVYSVCSAGNSCGTTGTWNVLPSALDVNGHGSHTSSTAAGNHANIDLSGGDFTIQGVAPHASLIEYTVCYTVVSTGQGSCPSTSTAAAANQAVADGIVDVLTFSIGGGTSPWTDSTSMAFLGAQNAGIFVVAAAGNDGPAASTVSHVEPWVATAAASTDDQVLGYTFNLTSPGTPPSNTVGLPVRPGGNPQPTGDLVNLPITQSPNFADGSNDGCSAYAGMHVFDRDITASERVFGDGFEGTAPASIYQKGIAVLHLDGNASNCGSGVRRTAALNAGAAGVIYVDNAYLNLGASDTSYSMIFSDWNNILAQINTDPVNAKASVQLPLKAYFTAQGDVIADFSSRGPAAGIGGQAIVKPEIAAPGVAILAAYMGDPGAAALEDGTSMATPHIAGSAALLRALHPQWTPTQIRSAMMMTAKTANVVTASGTPAGIWDTGSGRIDLPNAAKASLVFDETGANFTAANPSAGGKISTLNLPSIADSNCVGACNYSRTMNGVHAGTVTYTLSVDGFGGAASVSPASILMPTNGIKTFTVTVHGDQLTSGQYTFGQVTFTSSDSSVPVQHMPVAIKPGGPAIQLSASSLAATQDVSVGTPVTKPLTITNIGNPTLNWNVVGSGTAPLTLMDTATTSNGELGGYYSKLSAGSYLAQNFDVTTATKITKLTAKGFTLPSTTNLTTSNTPKITFKVYADASGVPAGTPGDPPDTANSGNAPIFTYTNTISVNNGISTTSGNINLDLTKAAVPALNLVPGRYWLVVAPNINSNAGQTASNPIWAWRVTSDPVVGNSAKIVGSIYSPPVTDWEDIENVPTMLSTTVAGTVDCTQPSWASYSPTSGALGYNGVSNMTVTFNPAGLAPGNYAGSLCVSSNATNTPVAVVPISFAVTGTLTHTVTPSVGTPSGSITPNTAQTVNDGTTTQFTLTPDSGYHIDTVGGTCGGNLSGSTYTTTAVTADCTVIANFAANAPVTHVVTPSVGTPSGSISPNTAQTVNDGTTTQFTLTADSGYHVDTVGGTCGGNLVGNVYTTNAVTADCTVVANFTAITHTVTPSVGTPSGSISPNTAQMVNDGATTQFTLTANGGYHIDTVGGTCGGSLSGNTYTTNAVMADCSVVANFAADAVVDPSLLYSNLGTDAGSDLLNGSTTVVGTSRYTPMVCSRFTLSQPGQQLITSFTWTSTNHNAAGFAAPPTTSITFYDDSGASGGPGVRLGNTNGAYYSGGNYGTTINPGVNEFTGNPFGYTATWVPAPSGGGNANVWACLYYSGATATFTDAQLSNLGMEKFANAPTAGSTSDLVFVSTGAPNGGSGVWVDNPPGNLTSGGGNVFGWELTTLGTNIMLDTYQMKNSSGTAATGTIALNGATGVARNFSGYAATITAPASGNKWSVTGLQLTPLCNAAATFNAAQAKIQFWDTFAGSTASPVFSNSAPIASVTANLDTVTANGCTSGTYYILPVRLGTPVTVGAGATLGVTIEYLTDTGSGLGANGDLVSLTNSASNGYAPAVGANASTGATGWYKSASNRSDLNFQSGDYVTGTRVHIPVRVYGNQISATGSVVPMARQLTSQNPLEQPVQQAAEGNAPIQIQIH